VELSSPSQGTSAEPRRGDRPGQAPIGLLLRGLLMLVTIIGLVAALHYYLGVRLVSDPGLPQPWAALGWGMLGLGFASIPGAMASTRMRPSWKEQVLHWGGMLWMGAFGLLLTAMVAADVVGVVVPTMLFTIAGVRVYTNRGTGYWGPPLRLGPAPEITELTLVRA
jgi:uncharacterized protein